MNNLFKLKKIKRGSIKNVKSQKITREVKELPDNLFMKCNKCSSSFLENKLRELYFVCPNCSNHMRIAALDRIEMVLDPGFEFLPHSLITKNPLNFPGYEEKIKTSIDKTGLKEAVITVAGKIEGQPVVMAVLDSGFMMGSMGAVVGEKITEAIEYATDHTMPIIIFSASGGARMQEGIFSLMQMAKTSGAVAKHDEKGLLFISYLTHPTTGGVTASFASLGDVIMAEPGALIGFAGPRVIEQTIRQKLPEGFQSAEFLLDHGFVDKVVERKDMRKMISLLLKLHQYGKERNL